MLHRFAVMVLLLLGYSTATFAELAQTEPIDITRAEVVDMTAAIVWCAAEPELGIEAVSAGGCRFRPVRDQSELTPGLSRQAYWLRFTLYNDTAESSLRWLRVGHPRLNSVTLYRPAADGAWIATATGLSVPSRERPVLAETPILPVNLEANATKTYYLRIASDTAIVLRTVLVTPRAQVIASQFNRLISYLSLGAVALAGIFCLIVYAKLGNVSLLLFSGTLFFVAIADAGYTGLTATFLWPAHLPFPIQSNIVAACAAIICFTAFVISFIPPHPGLKRIKAVLVMQCAVLLILAAWTLAAGLRHGLPYLYITATITALVLMLAVFVVGAWRQGRAVPVLLLCGISPIVLLLLLRMTMLLGFGNYAVIHEIGFSWTMALVSPVIISSLFKQADELRQRLAAADVESAIRSQILAHISHDFRTPLNVIIQYADLVARGSSRVGSREAMSAIKQSGYDLLAMIDTVLEYVRPDAKDIELRLVDTPLAPFLYELEIRARHLGELNGNTFAIEIDEAAPHAVRIDKVRLKQVLNNLIGNAHAYTKNGAVVLRCHAEQGEAGRCLLTFSVRDTGIGIPPEDHIRIFQPYVRGDAARTSGVAGFGIGLALCQRLVGLMGSEISLVSQPGMGSRFSFTVACDIGCEEVQPRSYEPRSGRRHTLLLVDDDPLARDFLVMQLAPYDVEVLTAGCGSEATCRWTDDIDLVITDQFMAEGDGWTVLAHAAARDVPTLLISAARPQRPDELAGSVQFAGVLQKPFEADELIAAIDRLLGGLARRGDIAKAITEERSCDRPSEALLAALRQMIKEGAVTKIDLWVREAERLHPEHGGFWSSVRAANNRLDFARLHELIGEAP